MLDILIHLAICLIPAFVFYVITLRKECKKQEQEIKQYKAIIKALDAELKAANKKNEALMWACGHKAAKKQSQTPAFLLADDPMDALLKGVGKASK